MFRYPPVVELPPAVPTYTFPFATLGTVNLTAMPAGTSVDEILVQEVAVDEVVYRQSRVAASKAHNLALPPLDALVASIAHTMAFVEALLGAETVGVGPGHPKVCVVFAEGVVQNPAPVVPVQLEPLG
jgi:hypothetical protein